MLDFQEQNEWSSSLEVDEAQRSKGRGGAQKDNPGRFDNDRERAREAGRKGGRVSGGNFKNNPERAREAGRKGGSR